MEELHAPELTASDVALDLVEQRPLRFVAGQLPAEIGRTTHVTSVANVRSPGVPLQWSGGGATPSMPARRTVRITTAYFVPDDTADLLCETAGRGVDVQVVVPGPHADKRFVQLAGEARFQSLLDAGVKIWSFQPAMLHAKIMTVDGLVANVGSANFDARSLLRDDEVSMVLYDPDITAALEGDFEADVARSEPFDGSEWAERGIMQRAKEAVTSVIDEHL
jgi:hypothetical protein